MVFVLETQSLEFTILRIADQVGHPLTTGRHSLIVEKACAGEPDYGAASEVWDDGGNMCARPGCDEQIPPTAQFCSKEHAKYSHIPFIISHRSLTSVE